MGPIAGFGIAVVIDVVAVQPLYHPEQVRRHGLGAGIVEMVEVNAFLALLQEGPDSDLKRRMVALPDCPLRGDPAFVLLLADSLAGDDGAVGSLCANHDAPEAG